VIHALADATHFSEHGGRGKFRDDQFFRSGSPEGLNAAFFEKKQDLAALARAEKNMPFAKVSNHGACFHGFQRGSGKVFEEIHCR